MIIITTETVVLYIVHYIVHSLAVQRVCKLRLTSSVKGGTGHLRTVLSYRKTVKI